MSKQVVWNRDQTCHGPSLTLRWILSSILNSFVEFLGKRKKSFLTLFCRTKKKTHKKYLSKELEIIDRWIGKQIKTPRICFFLYIRCRMLMFIYCLLIDVILVLITGAYDSLQ